MGPGPCNPHTYVYIYISVPFRELTYSTLGKEKSSSKVTFNYVSSQEGISYTFNLLKIAVWCIYILVTFFVGKQLPRLTGTVRMRAQTSNLQHSPCTQRNAWWWNDHQEILPSQRCIPHRMANCKPRKRLEPFEWVQGYLEDHPNWFL